MAMEFWGVEVKAGEPLLVDPEDADLIHLSQAALGEAKKDKGSDSVTLFVKFREQKIVLGTLSHEKFPQLSFDLAFEDKFELSHNLKNGSVYFLGYRVTNNDDERFPVDDSEDEEEEDRPLTKEEVARLGLPQQSAKPKAQPAESKKKEVKKEEDDGDDESNEDDEESDEDDVDGMDEDISSDEDDDEDDESEDEDEETPTPKKPAKKRPNESATKTPVSSKKAKADTPQKTDGKKGGHTATPHPAKNAAKAAANGNKSQQSPKSAGQFSCNSCKKTFGSEGALQSHSKAKHSAK